MDTAVTKHEFGKKECGLFADKSFGCRYLRICCLFAVTGCEVFFTTKVYRTLVVFRRMR